MKFTRNQIMSLTDFGHVVDVHIQVPKADGQELLDDYNAGVKEFTLQATALALINANMSIAPTEPEPALVTDVPAPEQKKKRSTK